MDSLTGTKPASEGSLQDSIESDYTGCSTDPIASSTNSHSGLSTGSNAAPSPTMGTEDDAHDPAFSARAEDPTGQDTDRGEHTAALWARNTAPPILG